MAKTKPEEPRQLTFLDLDETLIDLWAARAELEYEVQSAKDEARLQDAQQKLETVVAELKELTRDLEGKWDRCARFLRAARAREEALRAEAQFLSARARSYEKARKRFQSFLAWLIGERMGEKKVHGDVYSLTVAKTPPKVVCDDGDESNAPEEWTRKVVSFVTDKQGIKDAIKAGEEVPNWRIDDSGRTIRIY